MKYIFPNGDEAKLSPAHRTDDLYLVYLDEDNNRHLQHYLDLPEAGTLIDPDTGEDMVLVGWIIPTDTMDEELVQSIKRGVQQIAEGDTVYLGSFKDYATYILYAQNEGEDWGVVNTYADVEWELAVADFNAISNRADKTGQKIGLSLNRGNETYMSRSYKYNFGDDPEDES